MKKLISLALAGGMVLSLAACGSSASTAASTATESTSTAESTAESTASEGKQLKIAFFMYETLKNSKNAAKPSLPTAMITAWMMCRTRSTPATCSAETNIYCSHVLRHMAVLLKCATSPW